jgi:hypothetical protein
MSRRRNYHHTYAVPGGSIKSVLSSINNFLKKTKLLSTVGHAIAPVVPYGQYINKGADLAANLGYGARRSHRKRTYRKKKIHGMGLLSLAGTGTRRTHAVRRRRRRTHMMM